MNLLADEKEQKAFLNNGGYRTIRKKMLCSCTLKSFFDLIESKLDTTQMEEATFTQDFLATLDDELKDVSDDDCNEEIRYVLQFEERVEEMIKMLESQNYYTTND